MLKTKITLGEGARPRDCTKNDMTKRLNYETFSKIIINQSATFEC